MNVGPNGKVTINGLSINEYVQSFNSGRTGNRQSIETYTANGVQTVYVNGKPVKVNGVDVAEINELERRTAAKKGAADTRPQDITVLNMKDGREESLWNAEAVLENAAAEPLDVNKAYRSQLIKLPFISGEAASRIIEFRANDGIFYSYEEFCDFLKLKPHEISALKNHIIVAGEEKAAPAQDAADTAQRPKNRRIIDY